MRTPSSWMLSTPRSRAAARISPTVAPDGDHLAQLVVDREHLVEPETARSSRCRSTWGSRPARTTSMRAPGASPRPRSTQRSAVMHLGPPAVAAQAAHQPLRDDAAVGGGHQVGRQAHLDQAVDRRDGVAGVQGGEHEVTGDGGVGRHLGGLQVAHLADHDDVGVGAHQGAQRLGEGEADDRLDLGLHDAVQLALDRVFDRVDLALLRLDQLERGVERGRLAAAGRPADDDAAVGPPDGLLEARQARRRRSRARSASAAAARPRGCGS